MNHYQKCGGLVDVVELSPYILSLEPDAQSRVRSILSSILRGRDRDLVTPLIGKDVSNPDLERASLRDEVFPRVANTRYSALNDLELDQATKIGSFSIQLPYWERKDEVHKYFSEKRVNMSSGGLSYGFDRLMELMPRNLEPVSVLTAYDNMPKGTNMGAPFFSSSDDARLESFKLAKRAIDEGFPVSGDPCVLFWRGQSKGLGQVPKQRTVWGYPHWITILELMLQMALLSELKPLIEFSAWTSGDQVNEVITAFLNEASQPILSVDFSGYDASVPEELIRLAFEAIRRSFVPSARRLIDFVEDRFLNIGLLTPEGILIGRSGSVPSGSGLTNLVDGLVQIMIAHYCAWSNRNELLHTTVQGDDGVWVFKRPFDLKDISLAAAELGVSLNDDKGGMSHENVYYLQNVHSSRYRISGRAVGVRPLMRILNGMLSYERLSSPWTGFDDTIRWFQQAEAGKYHPHFIVLADFLYRHDVYSRTMDVTTIVRKGGGLEKVSRDLKESSFPYGKAPLSKLAMFRIVRELDGLRAKAGKSAG